MFVGRCPITESCGTRRAPVTHQPSSGGVNRVRLKAAGRFARGESIDEIARDLRVTPGSVLVDGQITTAITYSSNSTEPCQIPPTLPPPPESRHPTLRASAFAWALRDADPMS
jgi:hypothetical protein